MPVPGRASTIKVRADPGVGQEELARRVAGVVPRGVEAVTGQQATDENLDQVSGRFLSLFTTLLTVFAGIALLVATFSIHNTYAIVVAQRTRENALLRALGASRRQVLGSTLAEAVAVGLVASAAGLLGGIGVAAGLQALFPAVGFPFPEGGLVVGATAMAVPLGVGLLVCAGSAVLPAVRAGRTAPLAALRETAVDHSGSSRGRTLLGAALAATGTATTVAGAAGTPGCGSPPREPHSSSSRSSSSGRSPRRTRYASSAHHWRGCAVSPVRWPGATRCAARSAPRPPPPH